MVLPPLGLRRDFCILPELTVDLDLRRVLLALPRFEVVARIVLFLTLVVALVAEITTAGATDVIAPFRLLYVSQTPWTWAEG